MSLPQSANVLVVGAGPTGLCLALALQQQGCADVVVVDGASEGENSSRAVAIHAATLEAFEDIGVVDRILRACRKIRATIIRTKDFAIETATFAPLAKYTKYPFMIAIPQHITEKLLKDTVQERGLHVHRPHKVASVKPNAEQPALTDVTFEDGHVLRARCVVGSDGSHSLVRESALIGWADPDGETDDAETNLLRQMVIADVTLANAPTWPLDAINLVGSGDNGFLFIVLPGAPYAHVPAGETVYRIGCGVPAALGEPPHAPDSAYLQHLLDAWGPNVALPRGAPRVTITQTAWSSRFRTRSSVADTFFTRLPTGVSEGGVVQRGGGPVLLLGDAAHIHPPMGGQGMNLGIRDAVRLAPSLAEYLRNSAAGGPVAEVDAPLRLWGEERRERARTVIRTVKDMQRLMAMPNKTTWVLGIIPLNLAWLRDIFLRIVCRFQWWRARGAYRVSGLRNP
ncbi:FAD/NAD-P-binding domain-containing protein [Trametes elegans]|nr:FAD/NAD-P-binding domain-containing protein [Trametes elegans]